MDPFLDSPDNQRACKAVVVYKQDRGFNSLASKMIKLSVSETKCSSLLARTRALILYISIWIFDFGPEKLPGLSRLTSPGSENGCENDIFLDLNGVRIWRAGRHSPIKNSQENPRADAFLKQNSTRIAVKLRLPLLRDYFDVFKRKIRVISYRPN